MQLNTALNMCIGVIVPPKTSDKDKNKEQAQAPAILIISFSLYFPSVKVFLKMNIRRYTVRRTGETGRTIIPESKVPAKL